MTECCPCIKYRERGQSRERRAPVRGPGPVGPPVMGVGPSGSPRPGCPASRGIGGTSAECSALGPLRGPLRAPVRPFVGPLRASARPGCLLPRSCAAGWRWSAGLGRAGSPLRSLWVAPVASGYRRPACARRPVPRAPPRPVPCASCGPRAPGPGPWWVGVGLGQLRAPCGRPARLCGLPRPLPGPRGSPLRSTPCGSLRSPPGAALRASGLLPPGGAGGPAGRLSASAPPGVWEGATVRPARQGSSQAARGRPCLADLSAAGGG